MDLCVYAKRQGYFLCGSVRFGSGAGFAAEETGEKGHFRERELISDVADGQVGMLEQDLGLQDGPLVQPLHDALAGMLFDKRGQVVRREPQLLSIEADVALGSTMLRH